MSSISTLSSPRKTPRQHIQRNVVIASIAERVDARLAVILLEQALDAAGLDAVPGWERLHGFVHGALRAQLDAAMDRRDATGVLARIDEVIDAVRARPE